MLFERQPSIVIRTRLNRKQVVERLRRQVPETTWFSILPPRISGSIGEREIYLFNRTSWSRRAPVRMHFFLEEDGAGARLVGRGALRAQPVFGIVLASAVYLVIAWVCVTTGPRGISLFGTLLFFLVVTVMVYAGWRLASSLRDVHEQEVVEFLEQTLDTPDPKGRGSLLIRPVHRQPDRRA